MPAYLEQANLRDAANVASVDDVAYRRASVIDPNFGTITNDAAKATEAEHSMTLLEGLRSYPKAVGWSVLISTAVVMEGFDLILMCL